MKKSVITILAVAISLLLFGCSKETVPTENTAGSSVETQTEQTTTVVSESETETVATTESAIVYDGPAVKVEMVNGTMRFEISPLFELSDSAWLGMVSPGSEYVTEIEARADRTFWVWVEDYETRNPSDPYVVVYSGEDIAMLPQEDFTMVLCDSDNNGKVVLQFPVTPSGAEIRYDLDQLKIN